MSQQINLYRPIFRRQEKKFSAKAMAQAGAAIVVGVGVLYGVMQWQLSDMRTALQQAEQQHIAAGARLQEMAQRLGVQAPRETPAEQVARLEREVAALRQAQQSLNRELLVPRAGYSDYFVALARQHMNGLWLTGVTIGSGGESLTLRGRTVEAVNVPRYVQRLGAERMLAGKEFEVFVMTGEKSRPELEFSLKTAPDKEPVKGTRRS